MIRKITIILGTVLFLWACQSKPKNFSILYKNIDTGLSERININGYYVSNHACDTSFYSVYMFYSTGLFTIATTSSFPDELISCFTNTKNRVSCHYPLWGTYALSGDTIKTQVIRSEGNGVVIFRDYLILPNKQIINISDYVQPEYTNLAYIKNYPSFTDNPYSVASRFYPITSKKDSADCPFIRHKWFLAPN